MELRSVSLQALVYSQALLRKARQTAEFALAGVRAAAGKMQLSLHICRTILIDQPPGTVLYLDFTRYLDAPLTLGEAADFFKNLPFEAYLFLTPGNQWVVVKGDAGSVRFPLTRLFLALEGGVKILIRNRLSGPAGPAEVDLFLVRRGGVGVIFEKNPESPVVVFKAPQTDPKTRRPFRSVWEFIAHLQRAHAQCSGKLVPLGEDNSRLSVAQFAETYSPVL
jgi:hypothetical protein